MGIRDQRVEIGYSIKTIIRCVYDIRNNESLKFQTGYVQYDNNEIPVWRPYDPNDKSWEAPWKNGKWENIYTLRMSQKKGTQYVEYEVSNQNFEGTHFSLPQVSCELMRSFSDYLKKQKLTITP